MPLLTRIYGPEAFGLLGTFTAILSVTTIISALAYPLAIVLPRDDLEAIGLIRLCFLVSFLVTVVFACLLWMFGGFFVVALGIQPISGYLFLIPLAMVASAWWQIVYHWLIRKKRFTVIVKANIAQSLILNLAKTAAGQFNPIGAMLISITVVGIALHASLLSVGTTFRRIKIAGLDAHKVPLTLRAIAYRYYSFPLYRAPQNLVNSASQGVPIIMLAGLYGPEAAGFYTLGRMVMGVPSDIAGKAINDVFYPKANEAALQGDSLAKQITQATLALFAVGLVPFGIVAIFGPTLFLIAFGVEWVTAGEYARWLAFFFLFNFSNKAAVAVVPILKLHKGFFVYEVFSTGLKIISLAIGFYWFNSDITAVALFSLCGAFAYLFMSIWIIRSAYIRKEAEETG